MLTVSTTTEPALTTSAGTDPLVQFNSDNTPPQENPPLSSPVTNTATSFSPSPPSIHMSSPPHKPRFSRSPTPYTLDNIDDNNSDTQGNIMAFTPRSTLQRSYSSSLALGSTSTGNNTRHSARNSFKESSNHSSNSIHDAGQQSLPPSSSTSLNTTATTPLTVVPSNNNNDNDDNDDNNGNNDNNNNSSSSNDSIDYKKPTAGWTLFAALAKMTPEEVELIRLTKANTAANKLISASSPTTFELNNSTRTESPEPTVTTVITNPTMDTTLPNSSPRRSSSRRRQREMSLSPPSPPSSSPLSEAGVSHCTSLDVKYSHQDTSSKSPDSRSPPSSPPSTNDSEGGSSPASSSSSSSSLSSVPSSFQLSPSPDSSPHRKKRSRLSLGLSSTTITMPPSALCWPRNLKLKSQSSPSSPPKSVQIDESKNMVFSYQSGSTIVAFLPLADSDSLQDRSDDDQDDDHENPLHKNDKTSFRNSVSSASSSSLPWWSWSSPSTSSPSSSQSEFLDSSATNQSSSLSPPQSWTPETGGGGSLDSTLSDSCTGTNNTFTNIASSLDRLWSPPLLRRTFSEVSSGTGSSSNRRVSRTPSGTGDRQPGKPPRIPMLRRQASMPSLEREMSEENPFLEPPPTWNPAISQSRDSEQSSEEVVNSSLISSTPVIQELDPAGRNECREVVMAEVGSEVKVNTSQALIESTNSNATTLTPTASSKSSRGVIRRRDTRHSHHPYRRPAPISNASQDTALLSLPAQFRRAASFNGTTSTPVVQPVLRREASTTAYMDTL